MGIGTLRRHYRPWEHGAPVTVPEPASVPELTPEEVEVAELHKRAVDVVVTAGHSVEAAEKLISEVGAAKVLEVTEPVAASNRETVTVKPEDVGELSEVLEVKE